MDISAVSEPILIKQRWFCHLDVMFFQIWHSATKLNYPFKTEWNIFKSVCITGSCMVNFQWE